MHLHTISTINKYSRRWKALSSTLGEVTGATGMLLLALTLSPLPAHALIYEPGVTLDPSCLPTDVDCGVAAPLFVSTTTNSTVAPAFSGTSTTTASTFILASTTDLVAVNATTTTLYASLANVVSGIFNTLTAAVATIANLTTTGSLTSTGTSTLATTTISDLTVTGSINLPAGATSTLSNIIASTTQTDRLTVSGTTTTNSLSVGTLSGILRATAGVVSAGFINLATEVAGVLGITNGGTGVATAPTSGQILLGNGSGGYTLNGVNGDATLSSVGTLTLAASGVTPGSYGSNTTIPVVTVDSKGRITVASATTTPFLSNALVQLNGLTAATQILTSGTAGADFSITSSGSSHTFNMPSATSTARGLLTAADWAIFNSKVPTARQVQTGSGLSGGGDLSADRTIALDIHNGLAEVTGTSMEDEIAIFSTSTQAVQRMTRANFLQGVTGSLTYKGIWNATTNSPSLTDGNGTTGDTYVVGVAGTQTFGGSPISFNAGDFVIRNGTWQRAPSGSNVASVFGRTGVITSSNGDYTASQVTNVASGTVSATNVQAAINELAAESISSNLANGLVWVGSASGFAGAVALSGDATINNTGALTLANTGVLAGTYGTPTLIPVMTVDSKGRITSVTATTTNFLAKTLANTKLFVGDGTGNAAAVTLSGDATIINTGALTLANSGVSAGTYGSSTTIPVVTVDAKGRITVASATSTSFLTLAAWNATTTDALDEGTTNLYYTDTRARTAQSNTALGLTYAAGTGATSLTAGYNIPLTASTTERHNFYTAPSTRITAGSGLAWSGNTLVNNAVTPLASLTVDGSVSTTTQTFAGNKTFIGTTALATTSATSLSIDSLSGVLFGTAGSVGAIATSTLFATSTVAVSGTTFITASGPGFYGPGGSLTLNVGTGALTAPSNPEITITGATGALLGSGVQITVPTATALVRGLVSTTSQNFAGIKNFTGGLTVESSALFSTNINANSNKVINLAAPTAGSDAANKAYVDALTGGVISQGPVINFISGAAPGSPASGDRYILQTGASGFTSGSCTITNNYIAQWNGTIWVCNGSLSGTGAPATGWQVNVTALGENYSYNGTAWVAAGTTVSHTALLDLQGGATGEYYHLKQSDYNSLTVGSAQLAALQTSGSPSFSGLTISGTTVLNGITYTWPATQSAGRVLSTDGSGVLSWIPALTSDLANTKFFVGNGAGQAAAVSLSGDATLTNTGALTLASSGVSAGTYGNASTSVAVTVDAKGRITSVATSSPDKTGNWIGTFDGLEGASYLARASHTGTQLASTISDFVTTARTALSSTATGLTYTAGTGVTSLTAGYNIPLTASTTAWNGFYDAPSTRITAGAGLVWAGNTLSATAQAVAIASTTADGLISTTTQSFAGNKTFSGTTTVAALTGTSVTGFGLSACSGASDKLIYANGVFSCGSDAGAGGGLTGLGVAGSYQSGSTQTFATSSDTNIRLTIASAGDTHTFTPSWSGTLAGTRGGTGLGTVTQNQLLIGGAGNTWTQLATSSLGLLTTNVTEGTNLYYTDARARLAQSNTATGLTYTSASGITTLTAGYNIPLTASTTAWNGFFDTPSTRITAGTNLSWSGNTLNYSGLSIATTTINGASGPAFTFSTGTSGTDFAIATSSGALAFNVPTASGSARGLLSSTDWTTFNNKLTATLAGAQLFVGNGSNVATAVALSGDATLANTGALTLANSGVAAGTYGAGTIIPVITVDAKGRLTTVATTSVATTHTLSSSANVVTSTVNGVTATTTTVNANVLSVSGGIITSAINGINATTSVSGLGAITLALGTLGTDVNVSGSPATLGGTLTINIPDASGTARGVITTGTQTFAGSKTFTGTIAAPGGILWNAPYTTATMPSAATYHGMFAHNHDTGGFYGSHAGNWLRLVNEDTSGDATVTRGLTVTATSTALGFSATGNGLILASSTPATTTNALYNLGSVLKWNGNTVATDANAFFNNGNSFGGLATIGTNDANALALETNNVERMRIDASGNVGIGTTTPTSKLSVDGTLAVSGAATLATTTALGLSATANGLILASSTPATTTNTLYNLGGVLKWGGATVATDVKYTYTLNNGSWANAGGTLPGNLEGSHTAVIGDYVYLFGGYNGSTYVNTIYSAPVSNPTTWTNTGNTLPGAVSNSQLAIIGDYVYLFGGYNSSAINIIYRAPVSNPTSWASVGTLPTAIGRSQSAVIGDYVYLFGGRTTTHTNIIYRAPVSNPTSWSDSGSTIPIGLDVSQAVVIGDYVYLFGGFTSGGTWVDAIHRAPVSNPTSWIDTGSNLPAPLGLSQAAVIGDYVYLFGGVTDGAVRTNAIYRAPVSDPTTWTSAGNNLPVNFSSSQIAVIGDYAYLFGGSTGSTVNTVYRASVTTSINNNAFVSTHGNMPIARGWQYAPNALSSESSAYFAQNGNVFGALATLGTNNAFGLAFETNNIERARFDAAGKLGIGTSTPTAQLHTTGTLRFSNFGAGTLTTDASGNVTAASDARLKTNYAAFARGLDAIIGLTPASYKWTDGSGLETEHTYAGFIAQNVADFIPEAVGESADGTLSLSDRPILAALVNATKELNTKSEINSLQIQKLGDIVGLSTDDLNKIKIDYLAGKADETDATFVELKARWDELREGYEAQRLMLDGLASSTDALSVQIAEVASTASTSDALPASEDGLSSVATSTLAEIASTTASETENIVADVLAYLRERIESGFTVVREIIAVRITAMVAVFDEAHINRLKAKQIETEKLCVVDSAGNKTCVDKVQFDEVFGGVGAQSSVPVPEPEPTPAPAEPVVEAVPEPASADLAPEVDAGEPPPEPEPVAPIEPEPTPEPEPAPAPEPAPEPTPEPTT